MMFTQPFFNTFLIVMAVIAVIVFIALFFVDAGYGKFYKPQWGPSIDNHFGWFLMEMPVFITMLLLWWFSDRRTDLVRLAFLLLFEAHYFHRSFIFPSQLRGHSRMPLAKMEEVLDAGFQGLQVARALVRDTDFVNKLHTGQMTCSACGHSNYCIGRMYTLEMKCHSCVENLPGQLQREVESEEKRWK